MSDASRQRWLRIHNRLEELTARYGPVEPDPEPDPEPTQAQPRLPVVPGVQPVELEDA